MSNSSQSKHTRALIITAGIVACFSLSPPAVAQSPQEWRVVELTGHPEFSVDSQRWQTLRTQQQLPGGTYLRTGPSDALVVSNAEGAIQLYENSLLQLPADTSRFTRVIQSLGEALFRINVRKSWDFSVETPYMIAGVKGTTFGIRVEENSATTLLFEGSVQITDPASGKHLLLEPGRYARAATAQSDLEVATIPPHERALWENRADELLRDDRTTRTDQPNRITDEALGAPDLGEAATADDSQTSLGLSTDAREVDTRSGDPSLNVTLEASDPQLLNSTGLTADALLRLEQDGKLSPSELRILQDGGELP